MFTAGMYATVASSYLLFGFLAAAGSALTALTVDDAFKYQHRNDIYHPKTGSMILLAELDLLLEKTIKNLVFKFRIENYLEEKPILSDHDIVRCPITQDIMQNPVLCALDGYTYEKEAILKWLIAKRNSPMTREKLAEWKTPEDVLIINRNVKAAIENYNFYENKDKDLLKSKSL